MSIRKYADESLRAKGLERSDALIASASRRLEETLHTTYHAVALDIDGTITPGGQEPIPDSLAGKISDLIENGIYVLLITGSGTSTVGRVVSQLRKNLGKVSASRFRLFAIIGNGSSLLTFTPEGEPESQVIVAPLDERLGREETASLVRRLKKRFQNEFKVAEKDWCIRLVSKRQNPANASDLKALMRSWFSSESSRLEPNGVHLVEGRWSDYLTFEITTADKEYALSWFYSEFDFLDVPMLRIGDQGGPGGNDFSLLDSEHGFSVDVVSTHPYRCFPVWDSKREIILRGVDATEFILRMLEWTPRLTLPSYLVSKAEDEYRQKAESLRRFSSEKVNEFMAAWGVEDPSVLSAADVAEIQKSSFRRVFDHKSGAVVFTDREWAAVPDSDLKTFFDELIETPQDLSPSFLRRIATDRHLILRGPAYYLGLAYEPGPEQARLLLGELELEVQLLSGGVVEPSASRRPLHEWKTQLAFLDYLRNHSLLLHSMVFNASSIVSSSQTYWRKLLRNHEQFVSAILGLYYSYLRMEYDRIPALLRDYRKSLGAFHAVKNATETLYNFLQKARVGKDKIVRKWREVDHPGEILATMQIIEPRVRVMGQTANRMALVGLMYGGIELPFVLRHVLAPSTKAELVVAHLGGISFYRRAPPSAVMQQFSEEILESAIPNKDRLEETMKPGDVAILLDDNVMTGRTIELARDRLIAYGVGVPLIGCVRFPGEGRIPQMTMRGHGGIDPYALGKDIQGLVSQSPYARIFTKDEGYRDVTGMFDLSRARIQRYLRKNGTLSAED